MTTEAVIDAPAVAGEPPSKKLKGPTGFEDHSLNISHAVMKDDEGKYFSELADSPVSTLQGIGPKATQIMDVLKIHTVSDLANMKYFKWARALKALSETEVSGDRPSNSVMNVNNMVDKAYETKCLKDIIDAPVAALQGISDATGELLDHLGVKTVGDLADFKYCRWAEAIVVASQHEVVGTIAERKVAKEAAKLEY